MRSVIRRRRLEAKIIKLSEHWTPHPSGRNTEALAETMMSARRVYLQFLRIRGKKFISLPPVKRSQELIMLSLQMNPHYSLPPRGIAEACSCLLIAGIFVSASRRSSESKVVSPSPEADKTNVPSAGYSAKERSIILQSLSVNFQPIFETRS